MSSSLPRYPATSLPVQSIALQGEPGNYAHMAALRLNSSAELLFCPLFEEVFEAVQSGRAQRALLPIENSTIGRIADIHHLMPETTLNVVGEVYLPVQHCLLGVPGAGLEDVKEAHSQPPALAQCRNTLKTMGITAVSAPDTAGAARAIKAEGNPAKAAIASSLAAEVYGLSVLQTPLNDEAHNTTRFLVLGPQPEYPPENEPAITTLLFRVRDLPAALYKALGGFATNGINLTKLESYMLNGNFHVAQFYADCHGHIQSTAMQNALEELRFYSSFVKILGCYRRSA